MIKKLLLATTMAASLAFSSNVLAFSGGEHCTCKAMEEVYSSLNLTPEQQDQIKKIKEQMRSNMEENRSTMKEINGKLQELVKSDKMDPAELDKLVTQKTALIGARLKNKIMIKNQIYNMLTPEQKTKFNEVMEQMKSKMEGAED